MILGYTKDVPSILLALSESFFLLVQWKSAFLWGFPQGKGSDREAPAKKKKEGITVSDLISSKELLYSENHTSESESSSVPSQVFV